ncbi:histidine kinase N-terminal 7TM domain-containing protein [Haloarculaceae archaeon H-GB2-1]|nr:histidine kinase N-terminal 7TM domain-containing protein [Haloarculaceae archaeon H-GB1-1]MEA5387606.1 histidine kinase N-terminal 7TM domain-containing protein [Haloarculaceae archaeon H-GB11]MEA5409092.1 histidine kinase N-terminal 7TM domain-containing protein [Haloarculaceae archaeon H-GB2-1]
MALEQWSVYLLAPLLAGLISMVLVVVVTLQHRSEPVAGPFAVLMSAVGLWSLLYVVQLSSPRLGHQLFWYRIGVAVSVTIPTLWFVLTVAYSNRDEWLTQRRSALLALDPILINVLLWTNDYHHLVWTDVTFDRTAALVIAEPAFALGYLVHITYAYGLVLAGVALLVQVFFDASRLYKRQAAILVAGALLPLAANAAFTIGLSPVPNLDLTTSTFTLTGVLFALALFRYNFLDLAPVARKHMIAELGDGVLVFDDDGVLTEYNQNVREILDTDLRVGMATDEALPESDLSDGAIYETTVGGSSRYYSVRRSPLTDYHDQHIGELVAFRDVTQRKAYEQRLEVSNRLLRHNLRNDMATILSYARHLEESLDDERRDYAATISETAHDVAALSDKASRIESTLEPRRLDPIDVDLSTLVDRVIARYQHRHPSADLLDDVPDGVTVQAADESLLETALENVVENAIVHNDTDEPTVELSATRRDGTVELAVTDDGPGIPSLEYEVLGDSLETPLEHGSGIGLWLVYWIVNASGGELGFETADPRGTMVVLSLTAV